MELDESERFAFIKYIKLYLPKQTSGGKEHEPREVQTKKLEKWKKKLILFKNSFVFYGWYENVNICAFVHYDAVNGGVG